MNLKSNPDMNNIAAIIIDNVNFVTCILPCFFYNEFIIIIIMS